MCTICRGYAPDCLRETDGKPSFITVLRVSFAGGKRTMKRTFWLFVVAALSLGLAIAACDSGGGGEDECTTVCDG